MHGERIKTDRRDALKLARLAAVAGSDLSPELASQVLGQGILDLADPWAELEAAGVLRGSSFAHDLVSEGTLEALFQYPRGKGRAYGIIRHWKGHKDHFHVRFRK